MQDGFVEHPAAAQKLHPGVRARKKVSRALHITLKPATFTAALTGAGLAFALLGCQQQYRPVVSAVNPVGPAGQPSKYAVAISSPGSSEAGLITLVDFSGDTVISTQPLLTAPSYFSLLSNGTEAFVINPTNSLTAVPDTSSPINLQPNVLQQTSLPPGADAPTVSSFTFGSAARILLPEVGRSAIAILQSSPAPALQQEISVPANPQYVVGVDSTPRAYALSAGNTGGVGVASAIESTSLSISATIPVGVNPVYGVETADARRAFILNKGSGTVSVINVTNNALDTPNQTITVGQNPVWADFATITNELIVLNGGDGTHAGSLSIINIPLCNADALSTNPSCNPSNPVDGVGFGNVVATVPVGINPQVVSVLSDGSRAYVANEGRLPGTLSSTDPGVPGSVSVVNLASGTVTATISSASSTIPNIVPTCPDGSSITCAYGHPTTIAATFGSPTGKVYVTSPDSNYLTVIETDTDTVDTHVNLQGAGVRVRVTAP